MTTKDRLREVFDYDSKTGNLIRKSKTSKKSRKIAGRITHGYRQVMVDGKNYQAHILVWIYMTGVYPEPELDHINRIKDDNRFCNLREVTRSVNMRNTENPKTNKSGIKGVRWKPQRKRWIAEVKINGVQVQIGSFKEFDEAACARLAVEQCLDWDGCYSWSTAHKHVRQIY